MTCDKPTEKRLDKCRDPFSGCWALPFTRRSIPSHRKTNRCPTGEDPLEGWKKVVSRHLFPRLHPLVFQSLLALWFIEYSYCWRTRWLTVIMPGAPVAWPWQTGKSGWWRLWSLGKNGGPVAEKRRWESAGNMKTDRIDLEQTAV